MGDSYTGNAYARTMTFESIGDICIRVYMRHIHYITYTGTTTFESIWKTHILGPQTFENKCLDGLVLGLASPPDVALLHLRSTLAAH